MSNAFPALSYLFYLVVDVQSDVLSAMINCVKIIKDLRKIRSNAPMGALGQPCIRSLLQILVSKTKTLVVLDISFHPPTTYSTHFQYP